MLFVHAGINTLRCVLPGARRQLGARVAVRRADAPGSGTITGTVLDPFGAVAAKVLVQAKSADGETVRRATSESTGKYTLADLPPGRTTSPSPSQD